MEDLQSKQYFETVSSEWDTMGNSFFGDAPRNRIYSEMSTRPGQTIADIGSGSGYLLEGLVDQPVHLVAIDQSPSMLEQIREKLGDQIEVIEGTSENLPLQDDSVDYVIANMYLHHVERPGAAIKEMVRILKQDGTLIFTDLDKHDYEQLITEHHDRWKGFDREDIRQWMTEAGLKDVVVDCLGSGCCTTTCCDGDIAIDIFVAKGMKT